MMDEPIVSSSWTRWVITILFRFTAAAPRCHCCSTQLVQRSPSGVSYFFNENLNLHARQRKNYKHYELLMRRNVTMTSFVGVQLASLLWFFFRSLLTTLDSKGVNMDEFSGSYVVELPCWQAIDEACWLRSEGDCIVNVSTDVGRHQDQQFASLDSWSFAFAAHCRRPTTNFHAVKQAK